MKRLSALTRRIALLRGVALFCIGCVALASWGFLYHSDNSSYIKISKSLAIFGEFFRQVSNDYVDEIDPSEFIEAGIEGMIKHLDPYTSYISDEENDEVDIITTGVYGGLGVTTAMIDSAVTIVGVTEGGSAEKAGLRVGDRIYAIDSAVVIRAGTAELRKHTRGKPGTKLTMRALRAGRKDTLVFALVRQEITLKSVPFFALTPDNIAYIRLERFTHNAPSEVRDALAALRKQAEEKNSALAGAIIDVRDNPGGLLDAAVGVCELFLPQGSLIVSTRGRGASGERRYYSRKTPVEPTLPLAVLINEQSASASEIVAGAIQDLDRGVLVGARSFGKGLVQTISSLPFDATLKMTTAKYYTPSGRCIQKIDYNDRRHGIVKTALDTTKTFLTLRGRVVRDANGVLPDSLVAPLSQSEMQSALARHNTIFAFANHYAGDKESLPTKFSVDKALFSEFTAFAKRSAFVYASPAYRKLAEVEEVLRKSSAAQATLNHVVAAKTQIAKDQAAELEKSRALLSAALNREILERFLPRSAALEQTLRDDVSVSLASAILRNKPTYRRILREAEE
jgi:carboxyl-terminal processing protease